MLETSINRRPCINIIAYELLLTCFFCYFPILSVHCPCVACIRNLGFRSDAKNYLRELSQILARHCSVIPFTRYAVQYIIILLQPCGSSYALHTGFLGALRLVASLTILHVFLLLKWRKRLTRHYLLWRVMWRNQKL